MKKLIYILLLLSISLNAQSWNSIITTNINVSDVNYMENHADKNGIHVVTFDSNNDIKYYLISSSGTTIRSATISTNGEYPNVVGDASGIYVVYREGSNIRVKKSTDAGANWSQRADLPIGTNACSGIDAAINVDGIHTVWSIGDSYGQDLETNYKKHSLTVNTWVDFKNVTDYTNAYGTSPTVSLSPSRVHVGYNSYNDMPDMYYSVEASEMSRTKYGSVWQTQQQVVSESGRGKTFANSSKLYDFYYDFVADMGAHSDLYFKYRSIGSTSWSSSTLFEGYTDVTISLVISETANGSIHTYTASGAVTERIIVNGSLNSPSYISGSGEIYGLDASSVYNDIYLNWKISSTSYLQLRQYDSAPATPQNLAVTESTNEYAELSWDASSNPDFMKYNVYRKGGYPFVDWTIVATPDSNSYEDTEITTTYRHGEDFFYKVTAVDSSNNESGYSNEVEIEARLEKSINGEEDIVTTETIHEYALNSNYPNPFNPATTISYQLPKEGMVNLVVYNSLGQEVSRLINKHQTSGKYSVQFNASNLPSGVYIYKLQAGEFSSTKKMILTK